MFNYECIEMVYQICGFVNYSNGYAMNGSIIGMDYVMSISLVKSGNLGYKQENEENRAASFGYYPRAADYTASGRMATMISNTNRDFAGNIIKHYKQAECMRMISKLCA